MSRDNKQTVVNVDFDGVIANMIGALIVVRGGGIRYEQIDRFDHPWIQAGGPGRFADDLRNPMLYELMQPYVFVDRALQGLMDSGYTVNITTSRNPNLREFTENWLALHNIPFHSLAFVDDHKREVGPDILVDDRLRTAAEYANTTGPAILFKQPWNQSEVERNLFLTAPIRFTLIEAASWNSVVEAVRRLVNVQQLVGHA